MPSPVRDSATYVNEEKQLNWKDIDSVTDEIREAGGHVLSLVIDITRKVSINSMMERTLAKFERIDILVNIAAYAKGPDRIPVVDMPEDIWHRVIEVDLTGAFLYSQATAKVLVRQGQGGRNINFSSLAGKRGNRNMSAYVSAKFGIIGFTQSLA